jgi:HK97 family phage prohead protease
MYCERKISATMRERKQLGFNLDIKSLDGFGRFAGYASVFDVVDNQRDIILRGAFSNTLKGRTGAIKLLWQHQQEEPIGFFEGMFEDENGLYVEGKLLFEVQRAKEAYSLLKAGVVSGLSIGYSPVRYHIDASTGVRMLAEVALWEVSLVTFPANDAANVTVVKQFEPILNNHEIEQWERARQAGGLIELSSALDRAISTLKA